MATINTSDELRLFNRGRILTCLRDNGRLSRTQIGENTGLSAATVTQVTAKLISDGVLRELAPRTAQENKNGAARTQAARRGRPQIVLELLGSAATTAVVTVLLNRIEVSLFDYASEELYRQIKRVTTRTMTSKTLKSHLMKAVDAALDQTPGSRESLKHVALAFQGTVTNDDGVLLWSPIITARNIDLRNILQNQYLVSVSIANDCKMIARALHDTRSFPTTQETNAGPANSALRGNFAVVLMSHGIGLGFYHQGTILTGSHSSGTELGHMLLVPDGALCRCGRRGCIEAYAADYAIWRRATGQPIDTEPVDNIPAGELSRLVSAAKDHAGVERDAFNEAGAAIGQGLANLFAIFDPFPTVLVGSNNDAFHLMKSALTIKLEHYANDDNSAYISIYEDSTDVDLTRAGTCHLALTYIDQQVFGFGEPPRKVSNAV